MSSFIDLDSYWRDRETYPDPAEFTVTAGQLIGWYDQARIVRSNPQNSNNKPLEFATSVELIHLTLPYTDDTAELPRVYVDMHSDDYKDIRLISTIDGVNRDARFVCVYDKIQNNLAGDPMWIHYKCNMEQVCRFSRDSEIKFRVFSRDGTTIPLADDLPPDPPNPDMQVLVTFKITPYIRDAEYRSSLTDTLVS